MNDLLLQLYSKYWDGMLQNVFNAARKEHPTCYPFLLHVTDLYQNAAKRVMFCGQVASWGDEYLQPDLATPSELMDLYHGFVNHNWDSRPKQRPGNNDAYWNFQWNIMKRFPAVGYVAQNVAKIGKGDWNRICDDFIFQRTLEYFPVWKEELMILRPDCIFFLTGTAYDERIRQVAGDFEIKHVLGVEGLLDKLIFKDPQMPVAYRTCYPTTLQTNGNYQIVADTISDIIAHLLGQKTKKVSTNIQIGDEGFIIKVPQDKQIGYHSIGNKLNKLYYAYKAEYPKWSNERIYVAIAYAYALEKERLVLPSGVENISTLRLRWRAFVSYMKYNVFNLR